ncbi:MAG: hypothetical protein F6K17_09210 [Okeania sp. SIO3C4]|nr:hypothetical protein [Okeania sp. SIO3C4]
MFIALDLIGQTLIGKGRRQKTEGRRELFLLLSARDRREQGYKTSPSLAVATIGWDH